MSLVSPRSSPLPFFHNSDVPDWLNTAPSKMVLRRSIGSLRSASSFSGSPIASPPRYSQIMTPRAAIKSSKFSHLDAREEFASLPDLDRSVDLLGEGNHKIDNIQIFEQSLPPSSFVNREHPLFKLPAFIRVRIYDYCLPRKPRKISLSPAFATRGTLSDDCFAEPFEVLQDVCGGLEAFQALRHELLTYFWTQYHFHLTLSPFTGPKFSPLSHSWLTSYLPIVQALTVEVDFTKFGGGILRGASYYGFSIESMDAMLMNIIVGLAKRRGTTLMADFSLLCRRYAGFRPPEAPAFDLQNGTNSTSRVREEADGVETLDLVPYCPELATSICDSVSEMQGILQRFRMSGFTRSYTETLMRSVFGDEQEKRDGYSGGYSARKSSSCVKSSIELVLGPIASPVVLVTPITKSSRTIRTPTSAAVGPFSPTSISTPASPTIRTKNTIVVSCPQSPVHSVGANSPISSPLQLPVSTTFNSLSTSTTPGSLSLANLNSDESSSPQSSGSPTFSLFGPYANLRAVRPAKYSLKLSRSRSFQDEFEEQMLKSKYTKNSEAELSDKSGYFIFGVEDEVGDSTGDNDSALRNSGDRNDGDHSGRLSEDYGNKGITSNVDTKEISTYNLSQKSTLTIGQTPRSSCVAFSRKIQSPPIPGTPRCLTPTGRAPSAIQNSPNTMNNLNEQDPAFRRTLNAMRTLREPQRQNGARNRPLCLQNTPETTASQNSVVERCVTSLSYRSNSNRKKYLTFVNKLRGWRNEAN